MKYDFIFNEELNTRFAKFYDKGYEEFGGWFCYDLDTDNIHEQVRKLAKKMLNNEECSIEDIEGSEYITYISKNGVSIRSLCFYEEDLNPEDYPETNKIALSIILNLIDEWRKLRHPIDYS